MRRVTAFDSWAALTAAVARGYTPTLRVVPSMNAAGRRAMRTVRRACAEAGLRFDGLGTSRASRIEDEAASRDGEAAPVSTKNASSVPPAAAAEQW